MKTTTEKRGEWTGALRCFGAGACSLVMLLTLGCWGETPPPSQEQQPATTTVAGKVVQGEVSGATVFADRTDSGIRGVQDADEVSTVTDLHGNFELHPSYSNYVIVSKGGVDTITQQPAIPMMAPAGAKNISPLTTLVALKPEMKSKIEALGVSFDADMSSSVTPAALLLAKSVETTVQAFSDAMAKQGVSTTQATTIQQQVLDSIATQLAAPTVTTATLSTPASLQTTFTTAVTTAVTAVESTNGNITVANKNSFATSISNTVTQVATAINPTAETSTAFNTAASSATTESSQLNVTTINTAVTSATNQAATTVTVAADTTPPTVTSVTPADGSSNIQASAFSAVFSEEIDTATINTTNITLTYSGGYVPGTISYNPLTRTVTFSPSVTLQANTQYTATIGTGVADVSGNHLATAKSWKYTKILSGSTGGSPF